MATKSRGAPRATSAIIFDATLSSRVSIGMRPHGLAIGALISTDRIDTWNENAPCSRRRAPPAKSYDLARLGDDTVSLLTPQTPVDVRRETLRRAALYATRQTGLPDQLAARLIARANAAGDADPAAWFDAGYFVETIRQAARLGHVLRPDQRVGWKLTADPTHVDGLALIEKAIRLGGRDMQPAAASSPPRERRSIANRDSRCAHSAARVAKMRQKSPQ
jgi:hypothetical protein